MKPILVVKVGTSTLLGAHEQPHSTFVMIAESIHALETEYRIVLVTSGAIGFGVRQVGLEARPTNVCQLQALAMIGQVGLLRQWREAFEHKSIGQMLLTRRDFGNRDAMAAFVCGIEQVWQYGGVPIVNENDALSNDEISFGDNDQLAAEVAVALGAERLVLLTDQDGIQADFGADTQRRLSEVSLEDASQHIRAGGSQFGRGGANSKLLAAARAIEGGSEVYIAYAASERSIESALSGKSGTKIVQ